MSTFSSLGIRKDYIKSIKEIGISKPTEIQEKTIPTLIKSKTDFIGLAQTGTGKTAAFAIPILDKLHRDNQKNKSEGIKAIVMVPTRELAKQVGNTFLKIGKYTNVKTLVIHGGVEQETQIKQLLNRVDVLVTTPGRMFDLSHQGYIKLDKAKIVVLDEADHMLDLGFIKDINDLMRLVPKKRQTLFFSATIDDKIKKIAYSLINSPNPIRIQIDPKDLVTKNVTHYLLETPLDDKRFFLEYLIKQYPEDKIMVFVRTKVRAERVIKAMERAEINAVSIHGDKEQKERLEALNQFKKGEISVLVATDVAARGIDISDVAYVVNYDLPENPENYIHRIGRTGRGTKKGTAISFCDIATESTYLTQIEELLGKKIDILTLGLADKKEIFLETKIKNDDWKSVINLINDEQEEHRLKKKKRKNRFPKK